MSVKLRNEHLIDEIKDCAKTIMDNAEKIVGNQELLTDINITISVSANGENLPSIDVYSSYKPEFHIDMKGEE